MPAMIRIFRPSYGPYYTDCHQILYTSSSTTITTTTVSSVLFLLLDGMVEGEVQIQCTALYSKEGQKSFFPETHGPEIVMEEQPENHFFWTNTRAFIYYRHSCALQNVLLLVFFSQSLRHETLKVWRDTKMLSLTPTGFFFLFLFLLLLPSLLLTFPDLVFFCGVRRSCVENYLNCYLFKYIFL